MSVSEFRKLNKIARNGLKSRNLHGGRKYNLEHFSCWKLLPNLHGCLINQRILGKQISINCGQIV
jgi:hypothetical protein